MPDYRMYVIGDDGLFYKPIELPNCPDDQYALEAAKPLVDGHDVELWQLDRKAAVMDHRTISDNAPLKINTSCAR